MIDWDAAVGAPLMAVFGEDLKPVYRPAAGGSFEIDGIFDDAFKALVMGQDGDPEIATVDPVMGVRLAQFPVGHPPLQGDKVTVPGVARNYMVANVEPDGKGWAKLRLNLTA